MSCLMNVQCTACLCVNVLLTAGKPHRWWVQVWKPQLLHTRELSYIFPQDLLWVKPPSGFISKKRKKTTYQMLNSRRCYKQNWLWRQKWTHLGYIKSYLKLTWVRNADSQINFLSFTRRWKWLVDEECGSEDTLQDHSRLLNSFSWRYRTPVLDA